MRFLCTINCFSAVSTVLLATLSLQAATVRYVNVNSTNPVPPFTDWSTAATNIQDAVDDAVAGDEVVVTNGVYATGGRAVGTNLLVNRVAVDKPLTVRSVNGPDVTLIRGFQVPGTTNGEGAIRCVYLTNGAVLTGFTLTGGATRTSGPYQNEQSGGGVRGESDSAVVNNCAISGNSAYERGGGAYYGTLVNCAIIGNVANEGGGIYHCSSRNCTLTGNAASGGGGASQGALINCIVYFNTSTAYPYFANHLSSALTNCFTTPLPFTGFGNFSQDPQLASASRLGYSSPCIGAGASAYTAGTDIDGDAWNSPPSVGCDEFRPESATGPITVQVMAAGTNVAVGFAVEFQAVIAGRTLASAWDFGDGTVVSNRPYASHAWNVPGVYTVVLRAWNRDNPGGISATTTVQAVVATHYVAPDSASPVAPYDSWATAATNIQTAVDEATVVGALVLVTNGVYTTGGRAVVGMMTNRVAVNKPVVVRSVNGPLHTLIQGRQVPGSITGDGAVRCAYLASGAVLSGFTLTNGATRRAGSTEETRGGGVWCESGMAVVTNCVLTGNACGSSGGGAYQGKLINSKLNRNSATGSSGTAGGAYFSSLFNCVVTSNSATSYGGGVRYGTLVNCTVTANSSLSSEAGVGDSMALINCVIYHNLSGAADSNYGTRDYLFRFCCTTPLPTVGSGNFTNAPLFANITAGNLRLQSNSPCINAGNNAYAPGTTDLDGNPRIVGGTVDIGAYEFQTPASQLSYAWLWQYGLPTDGTADFTDPDGDRANNWQEWQSATVPTNALSALRLLTPQTVGTNLVVSWQSVSGKSYFLQRSAGLGTNASFLPLASNLAGQAGTTTFIDTNAAPAGPRFYRVGVQ